VSPHVEARSRILLTVEVEDYFQVGSFERLIEKGQWYRFETRIEHNTRKTLSLLDRFGVRATFFVLGWVADRMPELVGEITARGHEVASSGFYHRTIRQMGPSEFRDDLQRSKDALERASGRRVIGHRVPHFLGPRDLWALDVLAEEGYVYDSSLRPRFRQFAGEPHRRVAHRHGAGEGALWEFPLSTVGIFGLRLPIAGGNYFRQFPHTLMHPLVRRWQRLHAEPFVMYFHVWELDPDQPRVNTGSWLTRIRHYRNLDKMSWVLEDYFRECEAIGIGEHLGAQAQPPSVLGSARPKPDPAPEVNLEGRVKPIVTVVVPCYNEVQSLAYLANTLKSLEGVLGRSYELDFVLVDDGSQDGTFEALGRLFGAMPRARILRHDVNQGVAAAILTGLRSARGEVVCSIDCDCTYDPHSLGEMIPLLTDGVDLVTASPYHPAGRVKNVPAWRLTLSRGASLLYGLILHTKLSTYTSCFRVYRRSSVVGVDLAERGFLGVAEMLGKLDLAGAGIVEYPATLEVRIFGQSKMKVLRAVAGHLRLMVRLVRLRLSGPRRAPTLASAAPRRH
jgi:polysaccharide deacetylase family protein (PEP-CTERM system associated)